MRVDPQDYFWHNNLRNSVHGVPSLKFIKTIFIEWKMFGKNSLALNRFKIKRSYENLHPTDIIKLYKYLILMFFSFLFLYV